MPARHQGISGYALLIAGFGSVNEHQALIAPIRQALPPLFEFVTPLPYLELQRFLDSAAPWGVHAYEKSLKLRYFSDIGEREAAVGGSRATSSWPTTTRIAYRRPTVQRSTSGWLGSRASHNWLVPPGVIASE